MIFSQEYYKKATLTTWHFCENENFCKKYEKEKDIFIAILADLLLFFTAGSGG
jgi:hypothetical protein